MGALKRGAAAFMNVSSASKLRSTVASLQRQANEEITKTDVL